MLHSLIKKQRLNMAAIKILWEQQQQLREKENPSNMLIREDEQHSPYDYEEGDDES